MFQRILPRTASCEERAMRMDWMAAGAVTICVLTATSAPAQERQIGGIGVTVFSDSNFRGSNATFRTAIPNLQSAGLNDRISSLEVAAGEMWEGCEHADFRGRCQVFSGR